tara:strand:+ start:281 stop:448 length:168 start_codon:yes stop_codon:yes gene_type:complete
MNKEQIKEFFIGLSLLILSPVYVPLGALWIARHEIIGFYIDCFRALTFRGYDSDH